MIRSHAASCTIGIDEVGRGPLAGPVVVVAAAIKSGFRRIHRALGALRDSKRLTPRAREKWFSHFISHPCIAYATAKVFPKTVDRINITRAANLAAWRACARLVAKSGASKAVYLDGGLYLKNKFASAALGARTVICGDERIPAIAVASIIAKVIRDRFMVRLAKKYPQYGFEIHKGYGTRMHKKRLARHGPSPAHRLTFVH